MITTRSCRRTWGRRRARPTRGARDCPGSVVVPPSTEHRRRRSPFSSGRKCSARSCADRGPGRDLGVGGVPVLPEPSGLMPRRGISPIIFFTSPSPLIRLERTEYAPAGRWLTFIGDNETRGRPDAVTVRPWRCSRNGPGGRGHWRLVFRSRTTAGSPSPSSQTWRWAGSCSLPSAFGVDPTGCSAPQSGGGQRSLVWWAVDELVRGVNPWRRL